MRIIRWLIGLPIILVILCFALVNRGNVTLSFWPSDIDVNLPLSLLIIGIFFAGAVFGQLLAWLASLSRRIESARLRRALQRLQNDKAILPPEPTANPSTLQPSLIAKLKGVFKK